MISHRTTAFTALLTIGSGLMFSLSADAAGHSAGCLIENQRFVCAKGKSKAEKFAAFANSQTLKNIQAIGNGKVYFSSPSEQELFRRSVEKERKAIQSYADSKFRNYRRRKMSAEEFQAVRDQFEQGMQNYHAALGLYRNEEWISPKRANGAEDVAIDQ